MTHVISASRRTDIPAFYADWFVNRLKSGSVAVRNPYSGKASSVSLAAGDVSAVVFWSKNYSPLLSKLEAVERTTKNLFFHFTITANKELESAVPDHTEAIRDYIFLVERYSPRQVVWRFDPICITDRLPFEVQEERFVKCAELLKGHTETCIISFAHPYKKVLANFQKYTAQRLIDPPQELKREYARRLAMEAKKYGIRLYACCNDYLLSEEINKAICVDGRLLSEIFQTPIDTRPAVTRKECACTKSIDIGAYDTCGHGCLYCYANSDKERAAAAVRRHCPDWNGLLGQVEV